MKADWSAYPNFSKDEFDCKETGENEMQHEFMLRLQVLRAAYGRPMSINSGFRSPRHSVERGKAKPGSHTMGRAADIACAGVDAYHLIALAIEHGFTGIGVQQKGGGRYLHLDDLPNGNGFSRPTVWSY